MQTRTKPPRSTVRFVVGRRAVELHGPAATRSLLTMLREDLKLLGTKEGCAEGDCGACCVAVADKDADGSIRCASVNSCLQPVAQLDGKVVVTIEDLALPGGAPGPLQAAFVDAHASQCGFCTPGLVMASAGMLACGRRLAAPDVVAGLSGNLCRCTGYQAIVDAVLRFQQSADAPCAFDTALLASGFDLLGARAPASFAWDHEGHTVRIPRDVAELEHLLALQPDAVLVAGATDLAVGFAKRFDRPAHAIFIGHLCELGRITTTAGQLEIGALATWSTLETELPGQFPELTEMLRRFASPLIRNVATLGGNLATGSPVGDAIPVLLALDASVVLRSLASERSVAIADFHTGYRKSCLRPGEFIAQVRVPLPAGPRPHMRFYKLSKRFDQDISSLSAAFHMRVDAHGCFSEVRIAFGGMAETAKRAPACERSLEGHALTPRAIDSALAALDLDFKPIDDVRGTAAYRMQAAKGLLLRFLVEISQPPAVHGMVTSVRSDRIQEQLA